MALKAIIASLDSVPEAVRPLYVEHEGKFKLDVEEAEGFDLQNINGLKSALVKERQNVDRVNKQLAQFVGIDPVAAREALDKYEEVKNFKPDEKIAAGIAAREKQLLASFEKDKKVLSEEIELTRKQLSDTMIRDAARAAIAKNKGNIDLLMPHVTSRIKMEQDANKRYTAVVVDADGHPIIDGTGAPVSIEKFVESLSSNKTYAAAFESQSNSGSGGSGSGTRTGNRGTTVSATDLEALGQNIDKIASGEVKVAFGS